MAVRMGTETDVGWIARLERECETAPHWGEAEYRRILEGKTGVRRCLVVDGAERGFAVGKVVGDQAELESVAVDAEARRLGVGRSLCEAVLLWCAAEGAECVELEVRVGSVGARRMYERLGFVEVGCRAKYYAGPVEDAVLMRLEAISRTSAGLR